MKNNPLEPDDLNLISLAQQYSDEDKARALLESLRWPDGPVCPHCKADGSECKDVYKLTPKPTSKSPGRKGLYKCAACRKQFTVTVGTIFEDSHIKISTWLMAIFILCSSKKAVSSHQLHRMLGITYKSSWFMAHRIRFAMGPDRNKKLKNIVEVDESLIGGKGEMRTKTVRHVPIVALIERHGGMHTQVVADVTAKTLRRVIEGYVEKDAVVNTDDSRIYRGKLKDFARHDVVNHTRKQYTVKMLDGTVKSINSCESFFSLLKRGVIGSWHHVSKEHLPKYADEFSFRWTHRHVTDGERMTNLIPQIEGRRLTYRQVV